MPSAGGRRGQSPFSRQNTHIFTTNGSSHNDKRLPDSEKRSNFQSRPAANKNLEYVGFQRKILSRLGYFGISTTRIMEFGSYTGQNYHLSSNTAFGIFMYTVLHINVTIKAIFLAFLVMDYFGPIEFLDKIASLDYILCTGLVVIGAWMFLLRYPYYGK